MAASFQSEPCDMFRSRQPRRTMGARRDNSGSTHLVCRWMGGAQSLQAAQLLLPAVQQGMRRRSVQSQTLLVLVGVLAVPAVLRRRRTCWRWRAGGDRTNETR
jgi:hypothetical protein